MPWLAEQAAKQPAGLIEASVRLSAKRKLPCRLIACRVPEEIANRRRQKLIERTQRKRGRQPSAERLAWCDWTVLVSTAPTELLSGREALVLYRARWQIELLFKRWKTNGLVAELTGRDPVRQMVWLWARLLAVLLEHWLILCTVWGQASLSLFKASRIVRRCADELCLALTAPGPRTVHTALMKALTRLARLVRRAARRNKRKRPSTFELLDDPTRLEFRLT